MKKGLLLVTTGFPFGMSEQTFISAEFKELQKKFRVVVIALNAETKVINETTFIEEDTIIVSDDRKIGIKYVPKVLFSKNTYFEIKRSGNESKKNMIKKIIRIIFDSCQAERYRTILEKLIEKNEIDIIYTYWCTPATLAAVRIKDLNKKIRVISRFHGCDIYRERSSCGWLTFRDEITDKADKLFFVSDFARNYYIRNWARDYETKCETRYLGYREWKKLNEKKGNNNSKLVIFSCSNIVAVKRIDLIMEALACVSDEYEIEWYHIGDGEDYGKILRAKGIVECEDGRWIHFDYIPGEQDVRFGEPAVTGMLCVIGVDIEPEAIREMFKLNE